MQSHGETVVRGGTERVWLGLVSLVLQPADDVHRLWRVEHNLGSVVCVGFLTDDVLDVLQVDGVGVVAFPDDHLVQEHFPVVGVGDCADASVVDGADVQTTDVSDGCSSRTSPSPCIRTPSSTGAVGSRSAAATAGCRPCRRGPGRAAPAPPASPASDRQQATSPPSSANTAPQPSPLARKAANRRQPSPSMLGGCSPNLRAHLATGAVPFPTPGGRPPAIAGP